MDHYISTAMLRKAFCPAIGREIRPNYPDASGNERVSTAFASYACCAAPRSPELSGVTARGGLFRLRAAARSDR
jgi:hypothetical protein